ncbi:MAG: tetratricopeptide repeat protein [Nitrospinota bacterium]
MSLPFPFQKKPQANPAKENKKQTQKEMTFLIVEDIPNMRKTIHNMLRSLGWRNAIEVDDGDTALHRLKTMPIDFVICDILMPRMPGLELLRTVREEPTLRDIPFLMVTADGSDSQVALAAEEEVDGYVVKPFVAKTLEEKIKAILHKKTNPSEVDVHLKLGIVYKDGKMYEKALGEFQKAIEIEPDSARTLLSIGEIHDLMGNEEKAEEYIQQSTAANPSYIKAHQKMSDFYTKQGNEEKAISALSNAVAISPNNTDRQIAVGKMHLKNGNKEEAEKAFRTATEIDPKNAKLRYDVGEAYLAEGMDEKAADSFRGSLNLTEDVHVYNRLGIALRRKHKYEEAANEYKKALMIDAEDEVLHFNLGRALMEAGQEGAAREHFEKALKLDPDFEEVKEMMKKLGGADAGPYGGGGGDTGGGYDYGGGSGGGGGDGNDYGSYYGSK